MKRVIVTGATSMLGIATIRECIKNQVKVLAVSRAGSKRRRFLPKSKLLRFVECDLAVLKELETDGEPYDVLYHFGWDCTDRTMRDDPTLQYKNVGYTLDAVELAHRAGCKVFIGAGSQAEYGRHDGLITEDTPCFPETAYGICKLAAGRLAQKQCARYGMTCLWTRTFSAYGTNDSPNVMTSYAISCFFEGKTAMLSSGVQNWDYLFEEDAGVYFYRLGKADADSCIVNVAGGDCRRLKEYIEEMAAALGSGFRYELAKQTNPNTVGFRPDVSRLKRLTGYTPQTTFQDGIRRLADHRREQADK